MESKEPQVSILIPTYNSGEKLTECVRSVVRDAPAHVVREIVIVDDGSTDNSVDELLDQCLCPDLRVIRLDFNRGLASALNVGIASASGALIARLDADDIWIRGRLEAQYSFMADHSEVVIVGAQMLYRSGSAVVGRSFLPITDRGIRRSLKRGQHGMAHSTVCFRRDIALDIGGYWDQGLSEDHDFYLRMIDKGSIANLEDVYVIYQVNGDSLSNSRQKDVRLGIELAVLRSEKASYAQLAMSDFRKQPRFVLRRWRARRRALALVALRVGQNSSANYRRVAGLMMAVLCAPDLATPQLMRRLVIRFRRQRISLTEV